MTVHLPDGTPLELPDEATGADAAQSIGSGLARAVLAVRVNGERRLRDLRGEMYVSDAPRSRAPGRDLKVGDHRAWQSEQHLGKVEAACT